MARAVSRGEPTDLVNALRLADRTGIVAASAPPADFAAPQTVTPCSEDLPPPARSGLRARRYTFDRFRRKAAFSCAAAALLAIGWVGGSTFATFAHRDREKAPAVATGVDHGPENHARPNVSAPPAPQAMPAPPAPPVRVARRNTKQVVSNDSARNRRSETPRPPQTRSAPAPNQEDPDRAESTMDALHDEFVRLQWFLATPGAVQVQPRELRAPEEDVRTWRKRKLRRPVDLIHHWRFPVER